MTYALPSLKNEQYVTVSPTLSRSVLHSLLNTITSSHLVLHEDFTSPHLAHTISSSLSQSLAKLHPALHSLTHGLRQPLKSLTQPHTAIYSLTHGHTQAHPTTHSFFTGTQSLTQPHRASVTHRTSPSLTQPRTLTISITIRMKYPFQRTLLLLEEAHDGCLLSEFALLRSLFVFPLPAFRLLSGLLRNRYCWCFLGSWLEFTLTVCT